MQAINLRQQLIGYDVNACDTASIRLLPCRCDSTKGTTWNGFSCGNCRSLYEHIVEQHLNWLGSRILGNTLLQEKVVDDEDWTDMLDGPVAGAEDVCTS